MEKCLLLTMSPECKDIIEVDLIGRSLYLSPAICSILEFTPLNKRPTIELQVNTCNEKQLLSYRVYYTLIFSNLLTIHTSRPIQENHIWTIIQWHWSTIKNAPADNETMRQLKPLIHEWIDLPYREITDNNN